MDKEQEKRPNRAFRRAHFLFKLFRVREVPACYAGIASPGAIIGALSVQSELSYDHKRAILSQCGLSASATATASLRRGHCGDAGQVGEA